jgi:hypothetical protein
LPSQAKRSAAFACIRRPLKANRSRNWPIAERTEAVQLRG